MDQFKQYGIVTLLSIALFSGLYSSVQLMEWQFFPYLQLFILSILTILIALVNYFQRDRLNTIFLLSTWGFIGFEWLTCLILLNQPDLWTNYGHLIFLPLIYFIYLALYQLILRRNEQVQKSGRILFYLLISATLTFFLFPNTYSTMGMELLFLIFIGLILFTKPLTSER